MAQKGGRTSPGTSPKKISKKDTSAKGRRKYKKLALAAENAVAEAGAEQEGGGKKDKQREIEEKQLDGDGEMGDDGAALGQIDIGERHAINEFKLGHVIVTATHEAHFEDLSLKPAERTSGQDRQVSYTRYGPVYSKPRKLVIIARYPEHMLCLPIYTNRQTGLRNKENKEHYMGVRDAQYYGGEKNEAPHGPCLIVQRPLSPGIKKDDISVLSDKAYIHITRPGQYMSQVSE